MRIALGYLLLIINFILLMPLLNRIIFERISPWDSISFFCPLISVLVITFLLGKNKIRNIHWRINLIGHIIIGLTPFFYFLYIFMLFGWSNFPKQSRNAKLL